MKKDKIEEYFLGKFVDIERKGDKEGYIACFLKDVDNTFLYLAHSEEEKGRMTMVNIKEVSEIIYSDHLFELDEIAALKNMGCNIDTGK